MSVPSCATSMRCAFLLHGELATTSVAPQAMRSLRFLFGVPLPRRHCAAPFTSIVFRPHGPVLATIALCFRPMPSWMQKNFSQGRGRPWSTRRTPSPPSSCDVVDAFSPPLCGAWFHVTFPSLSQGTPCRSMTTSFSNAEMDRRVAAALWR